ncbi:hypothetical protein [Riemerella anatipestifer]|uniref:hypothetical protein n=1 Tax=Riemerella anatipestifer TaxID=34085 RepID=UPI001C6F2ED1|nr:hypothetical protein [Riemerella anatipestifer]MCO7317675.1 hypothetical protein [Riemerella anatipestifer]MCT6750673.1 hypothetical protein [Riemerella anatipestifer]MCU7547407.1 hypothetical protein [Riemerella anatipestifer]MCU7608900.1 hypothetical protein [Riemerella anatipestifer]QYR00284.1 hypothetical protein J6M13_07455 [Riemerella anatipestifer]
MALNKDRLKGWDYSHFEGYSQPNSCEFNSLLRWDCSHFSSQLCCVFSGVRECVTFEGYSQHRS